MAEQVGDSKQSASDKEMSAAPSPGPVRFFFQEFLVDILGGLVPGLVFLTGATTALAIPLFDLFIEARGREVVLSWDKDVVGFVKALGSISGTAWFFIFLGLTIIVYVFGQIFYRRGPKDADKASFEKMQHKEVVDLFRALSIRSAPQGSHLSPLHEKFGDEILRSAQDASVTPNWLARGILRYRRLRFMHTFAVGWLTLPRTRDRASNVLRNFMRDNYGVGTVEQCEFPYDALHQYLEKRALGHLVSLVPWKTDHNRRSKVHINVLKMRLMQAFPERCKQLVRNEADVRLASGVWHAAGTLIFVAVGGLILLILPALPKIWSYVDHLRQLERLGAMILTIGHDWNQIWKVVGGYVAKHYWGFVSASSVLGLALYFRSRIEGFLHYQRMREVVYVLDTAFSCFRSTPEQLSPPFDDFGVTHQLRADRAFERIQKEIKLQKGDAVLLDYDEDANGLGLRVKKSLVTREMKTVLPRHVSGEVRWEEPIANDPEWVRIGVVIHNPSHRETIKKAFFAD